MKPSKAIIELATELSALSLARFRIGSVIYYKSSIVGEGFNDAIKTHPKSPHPWKVIDAEFAAVIDAVRGVKGHGYERNILRDCSIYTHRIKRDGTPGLAAPCEFCAKMLDWVGISKGDIYYSH
jgi:deoxycytidylate deaminase